MRLGEYCFDLRREELRRGDSLVRLTAAETRLLKLLAVNAGVALSREELTGQGGTNGGARTVDVQVMRLRRKIETDPKLPRYLQTVRGRGYMLRPD